MLDIANKGGIRHCNAGGTLFPTHHSTTEDMHPQPRNGAVPTVPPPPCISYAKVPN